MAAIVLAAGSSSRLGQPKQLVELGGETLIERAVRIAVEAGLVPVVVILGAASAQVRARCELAESGVIDNHQWQEGMASSIRAGVGALLGSNASGAVVMACDQPAVSARHLQTLVEWPEQVMASSYVGRRGVPAYFPRRLFSELLSLCGDQGAREVLMAADAIELPGGEFDIDTPAALLALQNQPQQVGPGLGLLIPAPK